ncbi:SDR family oxidoreductase [Crocinitomix algicola]|uniref:SDR family oxidoreductase n=1 Tax=Crocinitomix algicola TaxID=1740263 RepID=UPI0008357CB6|nr:SDR family oxidoreductase [Crocinitomix algicola]
MNFNVVNKKILITGAAGFIGSNLCRHLSKNNQVIGIDNLSTGHFKNVEPLMDSDNFEFHELDIRDEEGCVKITKGIDIILHQAALGSVPRSIKTPLETNANNVTGFLNLLDAARRNEVKRFVYATSSSVYGDHPKLPKTEETIGLPLSPYAVTKRVNELYADVYSKVYGLEIIGLRYFNVYGPNQDPNGAYAAVIPKFVSQILKGEAIKVNGDGLQTRDFTFVEDVIQANLLAAGTLNEKAFNQVFNISFGNRISLNGLIEEMKSSIQNVFGVTEELEVVHGPKRIGDIEHSFASIEKAQSILGYQPQYSLQKGLTTYLTFLKERSVI